MPVTVSLFGRNKTKSSDKYDTKTRELGYAFTIS